MGSNLTVRLALARLEYSALLYGDGVSTTKAAERLAEFVSMASASAAHTQKSRLVNVKVRGVNVESHGPSVSPAGRSEP
jgi:hypothetical protein